MIVLDTNIVLDLFVFDDLAVLPLKDALQTQQLQWIATPAMREELARVLAYKQIVPRLAYYQRSATDVLADFDRLVRLVDVAPKAHPTCKDPDDQKFIDLAVAHKTPLLSKDHAVLCMKKRLLALDVYAQTATDFVANLIPEPTA
ncbi:MAG: putative toxin-antitoxin system toxin component, PIN family [Hylemonella sp.]|nr:putative toxin-antitoxin system toxin component, PIN family [Hylemonella sp.]MDP1936552.1 putative toxin-antitoxin system toxin component, PIN family [Hylemonella sp.]